MILGNVLHSLFQYAITNKKYEKNELSILLVELLKRKQIIGQLYEANLNEEFILKEASIYLQSIEKWLKDNVKLPLQNTSKTGKNLQILNVCDIEESIWSPKYGVKGKLDLTLHIELKLAAFKSLHGSSTKLTNQMETHTIPVELKSGRTTFSAEHEGQVMLYSLLNHEKRKTSDFGLLLYLKDMNMKFIKVSTASLRGLIQLRNELVYFISSNKLPSVKNEERSCSRCPQLVVCSMFNKRETNPTDFKLYSDSIQHLTESHRDYFFKWFQMLEYEFKNDKQFESGDLVWFKSKEELESRGWCVFDLQLINRTNSTSRDEDYTGEGFHLFEFKRTQSLKELNLKENDMILLTSQTDNLVGIAQGFIRSIQNNNTQFSLLVDKNLLNLKLSKDHLFRIDKINFRSSVCLNYTNLSRLFFQNEICQRLRAYIIDKQAPTFQKVLSKQDILKTKDLFKKLNKSQKAAILKAIMSNDYLLIKGYPGTGKTTTIASLIAILLKLDKRILFTSFTNSAVDNLLIKLIEKYSIDFVRIGSYERIHPEVQKYELSTLTANLETVEQLDEFYKSKQLIATTCSSINHPIFSKIEFDYCVVDEASQVLLTTCLGPLFSSKKFILVGDLEQLPPVIKSKEAREMGMGVSLFEMLDSKESSVELVHQYRMNNDIMNLANKLTYCGKLECVSESTATSLIKVDEVFLNSIKSESLKLIFTSSIIFIDTSELDCKNGKELEEKQFVNKIESEIISIICNLYEKHSKCDSDDIGIIAPYNNQVKAIQKMFENKRYYQNIEVNTVDQFQGRDKRMILMSFTQSKSNLDSKEYEILNDKRRLTVAVTRSKEKLILVGSIKCLMKYNPLKELIQITKDLNLIIKLNSLDEIKSL